MKTRFVQSVYVTNWTVLEACMHHTFIDALIKNCTCFLVKDQKLVPQELELDGLEETPEEKEKKEKAESENIDEAKKIVEALTKSEGESCKWALFNVNVPM